MEDAGAAIHEKLVNKVFRAAHSIKGGAGFFGLKKIQELGRKVENVLDLIRAQKIAPNPEIINLLRPDVSPEECNHSPETFNSLTIVTTNGNL